MFADCSEGAIVLNPNSNITTKQHDAIGLCHFCDILFASCAAFTAPLQQLVLCIIDPHILTDCCTSGVAYCLLLHAHAGVWCMRASGWSLTS